MTPSPRPLYLGEAGAPNQGNQCRPCDPEVTARCAGWGWGAHHHPQGRWAIWVMEPPVGVGGVRRARGGGGGGPLGSAAAH